MKTFRLLLSLMILGVMIACSEEDLPAGPSAAEIVAAAKSNLEIGFASGETASGVTTNLSLTSSVDGVTVTWESNNTAIISAAGTVTQPAFGEGNATVTLTATLTREEASDTKTFTVTVLEESPSDQDILDATAKELVITFFNGEDAATVKRDLGLPTALSNDVQVSWTTSNANVLADDGDVTRPSVDTGDQSVTLTATRTFGSASDQTEFTITVIAYAHTVDMTSNMIANYLFNDMTANDGSDNESHGTLVETSAATDRFGNDDQALSFDGTASRVDLPNGLLLKEAITVSLWFKTSTGGALIGHQSEVLGGSASQWVPVLYVRQDETLAATFWTGSVVNMNESELQMNDNQWHHVVITADGTEQKIYIDNVLTGTGRAMRVLSAMVFNQIGNAHTNGSWTSSPNGTFPFEGSIDDVTLFERVLNPSEVEVLYHAENPAAE
ncbi:MAG: LamG domain-containing protein [Cytophagales bacterium]|nr:LamG domain-containing protein [Cytophagales bacterium]